MIKSIPIPTAGVSLGLAALGNLLQPYSPLMKYTCGILAAILLAMLLIKILRYPKLVHADMTGNPILGSVAATFFMTTMQLCVYIKDFAPFLCEAIWLAAVAAHAILIIWFSKNFMLNLELKTFSNLLHCVCRYSRRFSYRPRFRISHIRILYLLVWLRRLYAFAGTGHLPLSPSPDT